MRELLLYRLKLKVGGWKENAGAMREHNSNDIATAVAELPHLFAAIIMVEGVD